MTGPGGRPPYLKIADAIRQTIGDGTYRPGDQLPTIEQLADTYGVAKNTVSRALDQLKREGRVESWQGRGTTVLEPPPAQPDLADLRAAVDQLAERVDKGGVTREEFEALKREVGEIDAQVIDLYARLGYPNPRQARHTGRTQARRASGQ